MQRFWKRLDRRHGIAAAAVFVLAVALAAWATRVPPGETPYLKIAGAGFMFNYRVADSYYGYTAQLMKPVRNASVIESTFEDPAGGPPIRVETRLWPDARQYGVRTPNVRGIRKDRPYEVSVRLLNGIEREPVFEKRFTVKSDLDDTVMPAAPLTVGPGYAKNPAGGTQRGG
jgi:hypothetical protein